jgi:predicted nucleic acid-binding protein
MSILVDTSGMVAIVNAGEASHQDVMACVMSTTESLVVPITVLPEVDYLVTKYVGVRAAIGVVASIIAREFHLESVTETDLPRILELMRQYADSNIGFVDASIVAIAERLNIRKVITLDRRHFGPIRPRHCPALEILP